MTRSTLARAQDGTKLGQGQVGPGSCVRCCVEDPDLFTAHLTFLHSLQQLILDPLLRIHGKLLNTHVGMERAEG